MSVAIWRATNGTVTRVFNTFGELMDFINTRNGWWAV